MACKLKIGDTVAYTAKFLKNTGQFTGNAGFRRGELLSFDHQYARVRWNDWSESYRAALADRYGEDYAEDAEKNGQMVALVNICAARPSTQFCAC
ncbi:MAG: hypothetical protein KGZ69_08740 [Methylomonas sp.]|nr:hypothetical protein [Methylomonas sp.]